MDTDAFGKCSFVRQLLFLIEQLALCQALCWGTEVGKADSPFSRGSWQSHHTAAVW